MTFYKYLLLSSNFDLTCPNRYAIIVLAWTVTTVKTRYKFLLLREATMNWLPYFTLKACLRTLRDLISLPRFPVSVKFFIKIYFRLYERRASPPWWDLAIDYRRSRLGRLKMFHINASPARSASKSNTTKLFFFFG